MDEKKTYAIVGKVEIGTDEYRELIEGKVNAQRELDDYRGKYWKEQNKVSELEKQIEELKGNYEKIADFVKQDNERYQCYVQYVSKVKL